MNICFITNETYAVYTLVSINSIIKNAKSGNKLNFYILVNNIKNKNLFKKLERKNVNIEVIELQKEKYGTFNIGGHIEATAHYKFDIPYILKDLDKVLFIDCDTIIKKDLTELYDKDIEGKFAGVIPYTWPKPAREYNSTMRRKLLNVSKYFNSGVMLLNLKKIRENYTVKDFIDVRKTIVHDELKDQDQYVFNYLFKECVLWLDLKYDVVNYMYNGEIDINDINEFYNSDYPDIKNIIDDSVIIHTTGSFKPWHTDHPFHKMWLQYAKDFTEYLKLVPFSKKNKKPLREWIRKFVEWKRR